MYLQLNLLFCLFFLPLCKRVTSRMVYTNSRLVLSLKYHPLNFIQSNREMNRVVSLARCTRSIQIDNTNEQIKDKLLARSGKHV